MRTLRYLARGILAWAKWKLGRGRAIGVMCDGKAVAGWKAAMILKSINREDGGWK